MATVNYSQMAKDLKVDQVFVNDKEEVFTSLNRAMLSVNGDKTKLDVYLASEAKTNNQPEESEESIIQELLAKKAASNSTADNLNGNLTAPKKTGKKDTAVTTPPVVDNIPPATTGTDTPQNGDTNPPVVPPAQ